MLNFLRNVKNRSKLELQKRQLNGIYTDVHNNFDVSIHLREAVEWLIRAQDHDNDMGFSYGAHFSGGFWSSYPETTGYIIPTFIELADVWSKDDFEKRAVEAGDWEIDIQMECGAVMGGRVDARPITPAVFNTGTVLQGWAALLNRTGDSRFRDAGIRAANWLLSVQDSDGAWRKGNSQFAKGENRVYNIFSAWGLCAFGQACKEERYVNAAVENAKYTMSRQSENGWFADCCLNDPINPLLHTLAYAMQGLLEIGLLTDQEELISASRRTADTLALSLGNDGFISGRFDSDFSGVASWCCLTGSAQTSVVWSKLYRLTGDVKYRKAAERVNRYLMARHDLNSENPAVRGALAGSWPVWGAYGRFTVFNWATKFLIDALLLEEKGV